MLLADKRSENTRRAYRYDVERFFQAMTGAAPTPERVREFLNLTTPQMVTVLLRYKARLLDEGRAEATINRRIAAIMSLVALARRVGATQADPRSSIEGEKTTAYRDTRGISAEQARTLLRKPDRTTRKGRRDYAILLLLLENALRRAEVVATHISDFDPQNQSLSIQGKGRGTQRERITLSPACVRAVSHYLALCTHDENPDAPLFISLSPASYGHALTADGVYKIVGELAKQAGIVGTLSPHRLRHTAITMALDAAGGDIRRVQRLSRHARLETLQIYDDNRTDLQGEMTNLLSALLSDEKE